MSENFEPNQLVLTKIKGYPDWPSRIVLNSDLPPKILNKKPKTVSNQKNDFVCVKFYYDDQYSWVNISNLKPLSNETVRDYLISAGERLPEAAADGIDNENENNLELLPKQNRAGRKKRIVEAYLKVEDVPIDDFIKWGSWGKPVTPEPEPEPEVKSKKTKSKSKNQLKSKTQKQVEEIEEDFEDQDLIDLADDDYDEDDYEDTPKKNKRSRAKRGKKETEISTNGKPKRVRKKQKIEESILNEEGEFVEEEEEEEEEEPDDGYDDDWGLDNDQQEEINVNFNEIPNAAALNNEVKEMSSWCWDIRLNIQNILFPPEEKKKIKEIETKDEEIKEIETKDDKIKEIETNNDKINDVKEVESVSNHEPDGEPEPEVKHEIQPKIKKDYKPMLKKLDSLLAPVLEADISKAILKSSGLYKVLMVILKKPELQNNTVRKLSKWWKNTFGYTINIDEHWGDDFTKEMEEEEERIRKEKEDERRRKKREERKTTSITGTPEVEIAVEIEDIKAETKA